MKLGPIASGIAALALATAGSAEAKTRKLAQADTAAKTDTAPAAGATKAHKSKKASKKHAKKMKKDAAGTMDAAPATTK